MKLLKTLTEASCYFILLRIILFSSIFFDRIWFDSLNYHHQNKWQWYLLWWIFPIIISVLFSLKFRFSFFKHTGYLVLPFLITGTIFLGKSDKDYWGYYFKRPTIFQPVKNIKRINSISQINTTSIDDPFYISQEVLEIQNLNDRNDPYYQNRDRALFTIFDNNPVELQKWIRTGMDSLKISSAELNSLASQIENGNIIVPAKDGYDRYGGNSLSGLIIDFYSKNGKEYYYIALNGGQVENDHYPFYEFLFEKKDDVKLKQQQMYFFDAAGFEGFEYCILAPPLELFLFLVSGVLILVFRVFNWVKKQRKNPPIIKPINDSCYALFWKAN